jgi:hypothetical protein
MAPRRGFADDSVSWKAEGKWLSECELKWRFVDFKVTASRVIPLQGGVYAICLRPSKYIANEKPWKAWSAPMYIGRSVNLRSRFNDHVRGNYSATRELAFRFRGLEYWYAIVEEINVQRETEARLINLFGPPMNRVHPSFVPIAASVGDPIAVNLPSELYS